MSEEELSPREWFDEHIIGTARDPISGVHHVWFDPEVLSPSVVLRATPALVHDVEDFSELPDDAVLDWEALDAFMESSTVPVGIMVTFEETMCLVRSSGHLMAWKAPGVHRFELLQFGMMGMPIDEASTDATTDE